MLKMKDTFRRIGPTSNSKRKDTPNPGNVTQAWMRHLSSDLLSQSMDEKDLETIKEMNDDVFCKRKMSGSVSLPQIKQDSRLSTDSEYRSSETSLHSVSSLTRNTKSPQRKNSANRARSAENIVALINMEADDNSEPEPEKRTQRRGGKRNLKKRKQMVQSYEPNKLLEKAIEEGFADLVENLITSGQVNINKLNAFGFAPLHMAAFEGNVDVVKVFIDQGAYIDILTNTGMSALEIAVIEGNFDCAQLLISSGADQAFVLDGPLNRRCSKEI